jgi:hypothetical protein
MAYTKIGPFINGQAPALSATNLNHIEDGVHEAHQLAAGGSAGTDWVGSGAVRYVAKHGSDSNDGKSWLTPKLTVAAAHTSLPTRTSENSTYHMGTIFVGPGEFRETACPIRIDAVMRIIGSGSQSPLQGGTRIMLENGVNQHLFAPNDSFTGWSHSVVFSDIQLHGNKANNSGSYDCLRLYRGGFNCALYNVGVYDAPRYGLSLVENAVNVYVYNIAAANCETAAIHLYLRPDANLCNFAIYGAQIDNCGPVAPVQIVSDADGGANRIMIYGMETEAFSTAQHASVIRYTPQSGSNGATILADGVCSFRSGGGGTAVINEAAGTGTSGRFLLRGITGSGYAQAFQSDKQGAGSIFSTYQNYGGSTLQTLQTHGPLGIGPVGVFTGANSPENSVAGAVGSLYLRTNGGAGTTLYIKESGTGTTGWVAK